MIIHSDVIHLIKVNYKYVFFKCSRCRSTQEVIPQVLLVKPSWLENGEICSFAVDLNMTSEVTQFLELAPMLDGKYDGTQYRTLSFSVKSVVNGEESPQQEDVLTIPVSEGLWLVF